MAQPDKGNRWEGTTIIDSVIYIGSREQEEDKKRAADAKRKVITTKEILGDHFVLAEGQKAEQMKQKQHEPKEPISVEGIQITSYVSLEEKETFHAEQSRLRREHYIDITPEMREVLKDKMKKKGKKAHALFSYIKKQEADIGDLTYTKIESWVNGMAKTAIKEEWDLVNSVLDDLPDKDKDRKPRGNSGGGSFSPSAP